MLDHAAGRHRRHLELHEDCARLVPGLAMCAHSRTHHAVGDELWAGLQAHSHACWEIHWFAAGAVEWWSGVDAALDLGAFWCHVIPPGIRHGAVTGMLEPCEVFWMQVDPRRLAGVPPAQRRRIEDGLRALPAAFPAGDLRADWEGLCTAVEQARAGGPGSLPACLAALRLAQVLVRILLEQRRRTPSPALAGLLASADPDPDQGGVAGLARRLGCSTTALHRLFRHELGVGPAEWLRRQRLNRAKHLLRTTGDDISAIAGRLRFASSQQFATQFRQLAGITPSEYRRRALAVTR